jgi:hypothetical protein
LTVFFVYNRIISAVKGVEFVSYRLSYITLNVLWCVINVLNAHAPTEDKDYVINDNLYEALERIFEQLLRYRMKILIGNFNENVGERIYLNQ